MRDPRIISPIERQMNHMISIYIALERGESIQHRWEGNTALSWCPIFSEYVYQYMTLRNSNTFRVSPKEPEVCPKCIGLGYTSEIEMYCTEECICSVCKGKGVI